ncbi:fibronectin type III domain-containing protein 11-like [Tachysurus vachellii]|nr:fibronectin type III domain-containing protein 11-like [Tachysurus vachellii]
MCCSSGSSGNIYNWSSSQQNTSQVLLSMQSSIMDLLSTRLSPEQLQANYHKLDLHKKSSFSIRLLQLDTSQPDNQQYVPNSSLMNFIDMSRFQRVKKDGSSQVKLQLELLDVLHKELIQGLQELEYILAQKGGVFHQLSGAEVHEKIRSLQEAAENFDAVMIPGKLCVKHKLIPEPESSSLPQFQLVLEAKKPVLFNREKSQAFCDSVVLHWYIAEQEQYNPNERFKVCYRATDRTKMTNPRVLRYVSCSRFSVTINNLMPECSYEFSVKRLDNIWLVYMDWNDTIILRTTSPHTMTTS